MGADRARGMVVSRGSLTDCRGRGFTASAEGDLRNLLTEVDVVGLASRVLGVVAIRRGLRGVVGQWRKVKGVSRSICV